jgi:hypothetical protein
MPQHSQARTQVYHSEKVLGMALVPSDEPAEVLKPGKQSFDFPAPTVSAPPTPVLGFVLPIAAVRRDYFDSILSKLSVQLIGIVSIVADQILRAFRDDHLDERGVDKRHLVR